jgi:iron complex outermembrane receptor protein
MNQLIPIACLALIGATASQAYAQQAEGAAPVQPESAKDGKVKAAPAAAGKLQQVTVNGSRANDTETRRLSTASKMVFGREELDRNGDSSVGEILKRLPGVTMGGRPGRGGGVRMRGLGNGYTQMLVNGERPPGGFSLDSLSPDQVERIEVIRGPVAEHSTQAIAGTINIVLREGYQQKDISLKVTDTANFGLDYRMKDLPLTLGGSYNWTPAILVQTTPSEQVSTGVKRQFDVYGLWKFSANTRLRLAANNLLARYYDNGSTVSANGMNLSGFNTARTYATWSARLEMKL